MMMAAGLSLVVLAAALRNIIPPAPSTTVGIDLGTTFSCVAVFDHGRVHVIEVEANSTILPSVVALKDGSDPIVGRAAHAAGPDYGIVYDAKRFIGRAYDDEAPESLALEAAQLPFDVVRGWSEERRRAETHILPRGAPRPVRAEQISAMVLEKLRRAAEGHIGRPVRAAVLAVPVDFSEAQRNATREAARLANVEVLRLLHEPTAAAIAYGLHDRPSVRTVMVYDLGGGTLDVSLLHLDNGIFSVVSAAGNNFLGGQDVNRILARHFLTDAASPLAGREEDHATAAALRAAVERLKVALSSRCECTGECRRPADAEVSVPVELGGGERPMITLSRQGLERLIEPFVNAAMAPVDELLAELEMSIDDVRARPARPALACARAAAGTRARHAVGRSGREHRLRTARARALARGHRWTSSCSWAARPASPPSERGSRRCWAARSPTARCRRRKRWRAARRSRQASSSTRRRCPSARRRRSSRGAGHRSGWRRRRRRRSATRRQRRRRLADAPSAGHRLSRPRLNVRPEAVPLPTPRGPPAADAVAGASC